MQAPARQISPYDRKTAQAMGQQFYITQKPCGVCGSRVRYCVNAACGNCLRQRNIWMRHLAKGVDLDNKPLPPNLSEDGSLSLPRAIRKAHELGFNLITPMPGEPTADEIAGATSLPQPPAHFAARQGEHVHLPDLTAQRVQLAIDNMSSAMVGTPLPYREARVVVLALRVAALAAHELRRRTQGSSADDALSWPLFRIPNELLWPSLAAGSQVENSGVDPWQCVAEFLQRLPDVVPYGEKTGSGALALRAPETIPDYSRLLELAQLSRSTQEMSDALPVAEPATCAAPKPAPQPASAPAFEPEPEPEPEPSPAPVAQSPIVWAPPKQAQAPAPSPAPLSPQEEAQQALLAQQAQERATLAKTLPVAGDSLFPDDPTAGFAMSPGENRNPLWAGREEDFGKQ